MITLKFLARTHRVHIIPEMDNLKLSNGITFETDEESAKTLLRSFPNDFEISKEFSGKSNKQYTKTIQYKSK